MKNYARGDNHGMWKGGRYKSLGYILLLRKDHHFADVRGYVMEHRLVWEQYHNAMLLPWAAVHHKNAVKHDNRIENLHAMMHKQHTYIHRKKDMSNRECEVCYKINDSHWRKNFLTGKGFLCDTCYNRERRRKSRNYINYKTKCQNCKQYLPRFKTHNCPNARRY